MRWKTGDIIADKYRVKGRLGEGGMGVVLLAQHELLNRPVAVKVMHSVQSDPLARERFLREGRAMAQVSSPHMVRLNDVGELPSGQLFIVMERLEGMDLATTFERNGAMPIPVAVDIILQALDALAEAHSLGIVHRDLKPANLFLAQEQRRGIVKVLDFGISKELKSEVALTSTGTVMGSPLYMSPEQVRSAKSAHVGADIWALGVVLYEAIAGRPPFNGNSAGEVYGLILEAKVPPLASFRPDVPAALAQVITRCLAKSPADRFTSCGELAKALAPFGTGACAANVTRAASFAPQAFATTVQAASSGHLPMSAPISAGTLPLSPLSHSSSPRLPANASTQQTWSDGGRASSAGPAPSGTAVALVAGAIALVGASALGVYALVVTRKHHDPVTTTQASAVPSAAVPSAEPAASAPVPSAEPAASAPVPSAEPAASAPVPSAEATPSAGVAAAPVTSASAAPTATTRPRPRDRKKAIPDTSKTRD